MMPENTAFYAALPNLGATIAESNRIIEERVQQNPALRDWFANRREPRGPVSNQVMPVIKEFSEQLGEEIAVGAGIDDQGTPVGPVVLAELKNPTGFRAFFGRLQKEIPSPPVSQFLVGQRAGRVHLGQIDPDMLLEQVDPRARRFRRRPFCRIAR